MENASKALIMAGAILIAILLISVGIIVFNNTKGVVKEEEDATKTLEVGVFNSQFTKYCGDNVPGSRVQDLINFVNSYNANEAHKFHHVNLIYDEEDLFFLSPTYECLVTVESYDDEGRVDTIEIVVPQ